MIWGILLLKGTIVIQVDIGGYHPIPRGPPPLFLSVSLIVAQFTVFDNF